MPSGLRVRNLLSYQLVRLKTRGAVAMLQEFLRRGKNRWADKPDSNVREGSSAELGICSRPAWGSAYCGKKLPKDRHGSGGFFGGFLRWIFWSQNAKEKSAEKNPPENPPAENKKSAGARPPRNPPAGPKIRRKTCQQIRLSNFQVHAELFRFRRSLLEASSEHGFWESLWLPSGHGQGPHIEKKCTCNPSAAAGGRDKVCCAPFQTTLLVVSVRFGKKRPKNNKKVRRATLPTLAAQQGNQTF